MGGIGALGMTNISFSQTDSKKKVLKFIPRAALSTIDPHLQATVGNRNHSMLVYDTLFGWDSSYRPKPQMVSEYSTEKEGLLWRMSLRPGLRFHNGEPVTARDVVWSLRRWMTKDSYSQALTAVLDELVETSDEDFEFRLNKPFPLLPHLLGKPNTYATGIMPEYLAKEKSSVAVAEIIGSGPFRFVADEYVAGSLVVYERFEDYVPREEPADFLAGGKVVHVDRVEWHTIPDAATAAAALSGGEVDWWELPTTDMLPLFEGTDISVDLKDSSGNFAFLRMNWKQKPFDNLKIRQAVASAVRQEDFMIAVGGLDPAMSYSPVGVFQQDSPMASKQGLERFEGPVDYEAVRKALIEAGYKGERIVVISAGDFPVLTALGEVTADVLRKIGMNVDHQVGDFSTLATRQANRGSLDEGGWSVVSTFSAGINCMNPATHSWLRANGDKAFDGWPEIPELESLRDKWFNASDEAEEARIGREMQEIAFDKIPFVPLGVFYQPTAFNKKLTNILPGFPIFWNVDIAG